MECAPPPASTGLGAVLRLSEVDLAALSPDQRVTALTEVEAAQGWLASIAARVLAAVADDYAGEHGQWEREQVCVAQRVGSWEADRRLTTALALRDHLTRTASALAAGQLSWAHAVILATETTGVPPEITGRIEALVLADSRVVTVPQWRAAIRRHLAAMLPVRAEIEAVLARDRRRLVTWRHDLQPGTGGLSGTFTDDDLATITAALDPLAARTGPEDARTAEQRRADALVDLCAGQVNAGPLPTGRGHRAQLVVHLRDEGAGPVAEVGGQPLAPSVFDRYACEGVLRRVIHDPVDGSVRDLGRTARFPGTHLRDAVLARDRSCTFPGCPRIDLLHVHHLHRWDAEAGPTDQRNLTTLCRRHHRAIHEAGWGAVRTPSGALYWTPPHQRSLAALDPWPSPAGLLDDPEPPWGHVQPASTSPASGRAASPGAPFGRAPTRDEPPPF